MQVVLAESKACLTHLSLIFVRSAACVRAVSSASQEPPI